jgi:hypothetical protein
MNAPINPLLYSIFTPAVCQAVEVALQEMDIINPERLTNKP